MEAQLDFAALTPADALDLAVLIEEEARQRYLELLDLITEGEGDPAATHFFQEMARHEERHSAELLERRERLYPTLSPRVTAEVLDRLGGVAVASPPKEFTVRACLEAALAAERQAESFFRRALREVHDPEVRLLFADLAEEEVEHQKLVAARLAALE